MGKNLANVCQHSLPKTTVKETFAVHSENPLEPPPLPHPESHCLQQWGA